MNFSLDFGEFIYHRLAKELRPIIIYGTGNGAEKLLHHLGEYNIPVAGIFASDDFARERSFCGYKVSTYSSLKAEFGNPIILLGFATDRPEILAKIKELSRDTDGGFFVPEVPVFGNDIFTPLSLQNKAEDIEKLYNLLADRQSKNALEGLLKFKITADPNELYKIESSRAEVYGEIIRPERGDVFVDAGAYNGDTAEEFISYCKDFGKIIAIEPAPVNFRKLSENRILKKDPRVNLINCAVGNQEGEVGFSDKGGRSPYIRENGKLTVSVNTLDKLITDIPDIIKLDVEGAEKEAIEGACGLIGKHHPKLMISVYHRTEDFIDIPLLIHEIEPRYKLYLRHHPYLPAWETNLYAIYHE